MEIKKFALFLCAEPAAVEGLKLAMSHNPEVSWGGAFPTVPELARHIKQLREGNPNAVIVVAVWEQGIPLLALEELTGLQVELVASCRARIQDYPLTRMLGAGYKGFVTRRTPLEEMTVCLKEAANKRVYVADAETREAFSTEHHSGRLSKRQQEVFSLVMQGKSNKSIAATLGIAEGTVKIHVQHVMQKYGVLRRNELILLQAKVQGFMASGSVSPSESVTDGACQQDAA